MTRLLLVAYLIFASVAGPFVCCCSGLRMSAMATSSSCCETSAVSVETLNSAKGDSSQSLPAQDWDCDRSAPVDHQPSGKCPCRSHGRLYVSETKGAPLVNNVVNVPWLEAFVDVATSTSVSIIECPSPDELSSLPLFGREILRAYSVMRC